MDDIVAERELSCRSDISSLSDTQKANRSNNSNGCF